MSEPVKRGDVLMSISAVPQIGLVLRADLENATLLLGDMSLLRLYLLQGRDATEGAKVNVAWVPLVLKGFMVNVSWSKLADGYEAVVGWNERQDSGFPMPAGED